MNPLSIAQLIAQLLPYGIQFAQAIVGLIHKPSPTADDWNKALALAQTPFSDGLKPGSLL